MTSRVQLRKLAVSMRMNGRSYSEILKEVPVAKSTLSNWLRNITLTNQQNIDLGTRLVDKRARGRLMTGIALTAKRIVRENNVYSEAGREFDLYIKDPFFATGILLYWADGSKKSNYFAFINSDPEMLDLMVKWIKKYFPNESQLLKYRLFIHYPYRNENCEGFWSHKLDIPQQNLQKTIYKPTPHLIKKNPSYKGCMRICITRIDVLRKVMAWQKLLIQYYGRVDE